MPGVRCLTKNMHMIFEDYVMDTSVRDGLEAEGMPLPGSGHPTLEGKTENQENKKLKAMETHGQIASNLLGLGVGWCKLQPVCVESAWF